MTSSEPTRRISIRSVRKNPPDYRKLGRALIALAMAQAEADAQAEEAKKRKKVRKGTPRPEDTA